MANESSDRGPLFAVVIAFVVLTLVGVAVFLLNPHKTADFSVTHVDLFAPHTEFQAMRGQTNVLGEQAQAEDDLYIVTHIRLTDKLRLPLFISAWTATVTLSNGATVDATIVPAKELPRLGETFPQLPGLVTEPAVQFNDEVTPGSTLNGTLIFLFPNVKESDWRNKKSAELTLELRNQAAQTVKLP